MRIYSYVTSEKSWLTIVKLFPRLSCYSAYQFCILLGNTKKPPAAHISTYACIHAHMCIRASTADLSHKGEDLSSVPSVTSGHCQQRDTVAPCGSGTGM
jgi:hypothetical protein